MLTWPVTPDGLIVGEPLVEAEVDDPPLPHPADGKRIKTHIAMPRAKRINSAERCVYRTMGTPFGSLPAALGAGHSNVNRRDSRTQLESEADAEGHGHGGKPISRIECERWSIAMPPLKTDSLPRGRK